MAKDHTPLGEAARNAFRSGKWVDMAKRCKKSADNYLNFIYTCLSTIKALAKEDVALYADLIKAQRAEFVQYMTNIAQMLGSVVPTNILQDTQATRKFGTLAE